MSANSQPWIARRRVGALLASLVVPLLLILVGVDLIREFDSSRSVRSEVYQSYETHLQIERVFSLLRDAETGQRGYVITGDERFLEPYANAVSKLDSQMGRLEDFFATDAEAEQREDFKRLKALEFRMLASLADGIAVRSAEGVERGWPLWPMGPVGSSWTTSASWWRAWSTGRPPR